MFYIRCEQKKNRKKSCLGKSKRESVDRLIDKDKSREEGGEIGSEGKRGGKWREKRAKKDDAFRCLSYTLSQGRQLKGWN